MGDEGVTGEEWAEDNGGFFTALEEEATGEISRRKRNRQTHAQEEERHKEQLKSVAAEDELIRKARADEARRQIAAKVLSRASPREIQQAVKKVKKEGKQTTACSSENVKGQRVDVFAMKEKNKKKRGKRNH